MRSTADRRLDRHHRRLRLAALAPLREAVDLSRSIPPRDRYRPRLATTRYRRRYPHPLARRLIEAGCGRHMSFGYWTGRREFRRGGQQIDVRRALSARWRPRQRGCSTPPSCWRWARWAASRSRTPPGAGRDHWTMRSSYWRLGRLPQSPCRRHDRRGEQVSDAFYKSRASEERCILLGIDPDTMSTR